MAKDKPSFRNTTSTGRLLRLTGMTTAIASRVAGHSVKGLFQSDAARQRDRERLLQQIGRDVAATLSEMKGAVMKVGQIASQMEDLLPPEIAEALRVLQKSSAPMPFSVIRAQVRRQLGGDLGDHFAHFDEQPCAAASIGQVHRARTRAGDDVVVKVQYPAVRASIDSDLRQLRRILRLGGLLKVREATLDAIFTEIRDQLEDELDYRKEARHLEEFRRFHADDAWLVIPAVYPELSGDQVLTLSWEPGDDLEALREHPDYPQALRDQLGLRLFQAIGRQMFELGAVHCDPHPGNFAFRPDGSLVIYDFGAIKRLPLADLDALRRLTRSAWARDWTTLEAILRELGIRKQGGPDIPEEFYAEWTRVLVRPFQSEPFDFAHSTLHQDVARLTRNTPWSYLEAFEPSVRTLLVNRILGGHYWTLVKLGARLGFREPAEQLLTAFEQHHPTLTRTDPH